MDIGTVIGLLTGAGLIVSAIVMGGSAGMFINIPGIMIVIGGTLAVALIKFSLSDILGSMGIAAKTFFVKVVPPLAAIEQITELATIARKEGLLGLDGKEFGDEFLAKGMGMMIDGVAADQVQLVLSRELQYSTERHKKGQNIFKGMGSSAPAFGMVGTHILHLAQIRFSEKIQPSDAFRTKKFSNFFKLSKLNEKIHIKYNSFLQKKLGVG